MKKGTSKYASIGKAKIDLGDFYFVQRLGGSLWIIAKTGESMNVTSTTKKKINDAIKKVFEELF